jgi:hypothetical protein
VTVALGTVLSHYARANFAGSRNCDASPDDRSSGPPRSTISGMVCPIAGRTQDESTFDLDRRTNQSLCGERAFATFRVGLCLEVLQTVRTRVTTHRCDCALLTILMTAATGWITIDTLNPFNRMLNAALNGSIDQPAGRVHLPKSQLAVPFGGRSSRTRRNLIQFV